VTLTKKKRNKKKLALDYSYFNIKKPVDFDYANSKNPWCRYCGSRYSEKFYESPLGLDSLCTVHYKNYMKK